MRAYRLTGIRKMEEARIPYPQVRSGKDVLLKVASVGVCGSDIHYYATGRIGGQVVEYPFIVGHEFSASVVEVGKEVERVAPGDRVAVDPAVSCWKCDQCRAGRPHTCRNLKFLGCPQQLQGCLCEYIVMPEESCYKLSKSTSFERAALIEPFSIGCYAVRQAGELIDARIGILGAGPIGLCTMLAAETRGVEKVYVTEPIPARRETALGVGAGWAADPYAVDASSSVAEMEPEMLDVVFECCGRQEALDDAVRMLKPGGKIVLIGIPENDRISFSIDELRHREITIVNIRRQNGCVQEAIELMESSQVDLDVMQTHHFDFSQTVQAFDLVDNYADGVVKAIINVG